MTVRVFLVDDHPTFRAGLRVALAGDTVEIVGEAGSGEEAVRTLPTLDPGADVILMDLKLTGSSGIEATRRITASTGQDGPPHVLALSAAEEDDAVIGALRAGARGFLAKAVSRVELLRGVQVVADGGAVFSPPVASRLSAYFCAVHEMPARVAFPQLTERERQILSLVARGHDNRRIARDLVLAEKTVRNHLSHLFMKLDVTNRTAAAVRARDAGLGT